MTATLQIVERLGSGEEQVIPENGYLHLLSDDVSSPQAPTGYSPLVLSQRAPYSYERWFRAYWTGSYTWVRSLKFWADNMTAVTGWTFKYGNSEDWVPPVNTASSIALYDLPTSAPGIDNAGDGTVLFGPGDNYSFWIVIQAHVTNFSAITPGPYLGSTGTEVVIPSMIHYHFGWTES